MVKWENPSSSVVSKILSGTNNQASFKVTLISFLLHLDARLEWQSEH